MESCLQVTVSNLCKDLFQDNGTEFGEQICSQCDYRIESCCLHPGPDDGPLPDHASSISQVVPGSKLPNLMPKTKKGLAAPAGEAPGQEFAESAVQGSVGCFGFLARDDGSDEEDTIKAGFTSDDEPSSPVQGGLGSPRRSSQSIQSNGLASSTPPPTSSGNRLRESTSIEPRENASSLDHASSSLPGHSSGNLAGQPSLESSQHLRAESGDYASDHHISNSRKADAVTAVPPAQHKQILQHQKAVQGIKPPSTPKSNKFLRWTSSPFKESMRLFKNSMAGSTAVAA